MNYTPQILTLLAGLALAVPVSTATILAAPAEPAPSPGGGPGDITSFNLGWRFHRGDLPGAEQPGFDDRTWRTVDLPHDWSIEVPVGAAPASGPHDKDTPEGASVGYLRGGTGWYRHSFTLAAADAGKAVDLIFDGVQQEAEVWINGHYLGLQAHGYLGFHHDLTPFLHAPGAANVIAVRAINPENNSRWYAGSGLYRVVSLRVRDRLHIPVWGSRIDTVRLNAQEALLQVRLKLTNSRPTPEQLSLALRLTDGAGKSQDFDLGRLNLAPGGREQVSQQITVSNPQPWSPGQPTLYQAEIQVRQDGRVVDRCLQSVGIRTVAISAEQGFLLNGQPLKMKGSCLHHDNGLLGAAAFATAEHRRVAIMKRNGFNAIRTSHNPPSSAFLDACDRLGLLVIDEFTDMWEMPKRPNGYNRYFINHWQQDLAAMLDRDFNHPSVVMWSIGNEIQERVKPAGLEIARQLIAAVKAVDSRRPVTQGICEFWDNPDLPKQWDLTAPAFALLDVGGYNYQWAEYEKDHRKFPSRLMVGTESFALEAYENWRQVERHPYVIGDFVWTGMDHIGESGIGATRTYEDKPGVTAPADYGLQPWPTWINWCGDIDLIGNKKPQSHYRDVVWGQSPVELAVHAPIAAGRREAVTRWGWPDELPSWNWPGCEGRILLVKVYSRAPRVRLTLNGRVLGEQAIDPAQGITATFEVPYEPGVLRASTLAEGKEVASCVLRTSGPAAALALQPEAAAPAADRNQLIYVPIEIRDAAGQLVPDSNPGIELAVSGPAELQALGSANPDALGSLQDPKTETFRGRALAILRPTGQPGVVRVAATSPGLASARLEIRLTTPKSVSTP